MKIILIALIACALTGCPYRTPDATGGAIIAADWQIAAKASPDGTLEWARIVPPPNMQPDPGAVYNVVAGVDHTGNWSVRIFTDAP